MISKHVFFQLGHFFGCKFEVSDVDTLSKYSHHKQKIIYATCKNRLSGALQFAEVNVDGLGKTIIIDHYYVNEVTNKTKVAAGLLIRLHDYATKNGVKHIIGSGYKTICAYLMDADVPFFKINMDVLRKADPVFVQTVTGRSSVEKNVSDAFILNMHQFPVSISLMGSRVSGEMATVAAA